MSKRIRRLSIPLAVALGLVVSASLTTLPASHPAQAAESAVGLGNAGSFAVLGAQDVTNTGPTIVNGDLGVNAGSSITGFTGAPNGTVNGSIHPSSPTDTAAALAQAALTTAYGDAASRKPTVSNLASLDAMVLVPGVYSGGALSLNGTLTLKGTANDVFIFQATSTINAGSGSHILLTGGASACNVFWQVATSANIDTGAVFVGTVLAHTSISVHTGASVDGRLLANTGGVTLDTNVINRPSSCVASGGATPATPVSGRARFTG
jgi:hypothetical protein